jgi:hypothetical protein
MELLVGSVYFQIFNSMGFIVKASKAKPVGVIVI